MTGIEPVTSSLPRKRSTPELHRLSKSFQPGNILSNVQRITSQFELRYFPIHFSKNPLRSPAMHSSF